MIDALVEGVRSVTQACHLVILAPVAMVIVASRGRWQVTAGAVAGVIAGGWIFATRWVVLTETQLRLSALVAIASLLLIALLALEPLRVPSFAQPVRNRLDTPAASAITATAVGVIATQWWRPCVGEELGEILTRAPDEPLGQLLPTIGFMLGVASPLILLGLGFAAWQPSRDLGTRIGLAGTGVGVMLAGSVVVGRHGDIVAKLFEWSR